MIGPAVPAGDAVTPDGLLSAPLRPILTTLRPTTLGRTLLTVTLLSLVAAWLGGGPGFSVIAAFGGALCLVALTAAWRNASALRIAAPPPVTAFAGERFVLDVPVTNLARFAVAFDVTFTVEDADWSGRRIGALLPRLAPGVETRVEVAHPVLKRGVHPQRTLELASGFPLGLWTLRMRFALPEQILVLPRLGTLRRPDRRGAFTRGDEQEVYGIRALREGEGLRSVHWKLSARRGRLLVREFRNDPRPPVHVVLAVAIPSDTRSSRNAFEDAVSLAATLVEHKLRLGHAVRLTILGESPRRLVCRRGRASMYPVLRALAEAEPDHRGAGLGAAVVPSRGRSGETTYIVRVAADASGARATAALGDGVATVLDVPTSDPTGRRLAAIFDRRRRPGHEMLLGVRR